MSLFNIEFESKDGIDFRDHGTLLDMKFCFQSNHNFHVKTKAALLYQACIIESHVLHDDHNVKSNLFFFKFTETKVCLKLSFCAHLQPLVVSFEKYIKQKTKCSLKYIFIRFILPLIILTSIIRRFF